MNRCPSIATALSVMTVATMFLSLYILSLLLGFFINLYGCSQSVLTSVAVARIWLYYCISRNERSLFTPMLPNTPVLTLRGQRFLCTHKFSLSWWNRKNDKNVGDMHGLSASHRTSAIIYIQLGDQLLTCTKLVFGRATSDSARIRVCDDPMMSCALSLYSYWSAFKKM